MSSHYGFTISVILEADGENEALAMSEALVKKIKLEKGSINVIDAGIEDGPDDMVRDDES